MQIETLVNFLHQLLDLSGSIIKPYFNQSKLEVETKEDATPVTLADREAEQAIRELIHKHFPEHGIIGEEFGNTNEDAEFVWVLDPIDGTKSFITGVPLFGTLICLLKNGQPILGAIDQPILNQRIIGDGSTTTLDGKPVRMREGVRLKDTVLLTTDPLEPMRRWNPSGWNTLTSSVNLYRTWGDCYGYLLLATGRADIMVDPVVARWDFLPLIPIIRGAKGIITDWEGNDPVQGNSIVAAPPDIHMEVLRILNP